MAPAARRAGATPGRVGAGLAGWLIAATSLAVAPAAANATVRIEDGDAADAVEMIGETRSAFGLRWQTLKRAALPGTPFQIPRSTAGATPPFDYRLWVGDRRTEFGIGLPSSSPLVVALRHQLSPQTRLIIDTELGRGSDPLMPGLRSRPFSVGFESSPLQGLAKGQLLRAQLSLHSSVALRLRGGRLGVFLQVRISGDE